MSRRGPQPDPARTEQVRQGVAAGKTLAAIGRELGITRERVRQIVRLRGIPFEAPRGERCAICNRRVL